VESVLTNPRMATWDWENLSFPLVSDVQMQNIARSARRNKCCSHHHFLPSLVGLQQSDFARKREFNVWYKDRKRENTGTVLLPPPALAMDLEYFRLSLMAGLSFSLLIGSAMWGITSIQIVSYYHAFKTDPLYLRIAVRSSSISVQLFVGTVIYRLVGCGEKNIFFELINIKLSGKGCAKPCS
jgi:hypothetical protein